MSLYPHLHLLIPSSTAGIYLEARLYTARNPSQPQRKRKTSRDNLPLSTSTRSTPIHHDDLSEAIKRQILELGIKTLITAAHPWQKLGGNMLDPVLTNCLAGAIFTHQNYRSDTAVLTFNVRGVGSSAGSIGLLGLSTTTNEKDFSVVEAWAISLCRPQTVKRVGYSWGCVLALNAISSLPVHSTLLISPPSTLFGLTTLFSSRTFTNALKTAITDVTVVHGTRDQFTGMSTFQALGEYPRIRCIEVGGADHFYREEQSSEALRSRIQEWLELE